MKTLLLMSIVWMTFALPAAAARRSEPRKAFRDMVIGFFIVTVLYYLWVAYGHTRYFQPIAS